MWVKKGFSLVVCASMLLASSCGTSKQEIAETPQQESTPIQTEEAATKAPSDEVEQTEEALSEPGMAIVLNQIGYLPDKAKKAIVKKGQAGDAFEVINVETGESAFTGTLEEAGYSCADNKNSFVADFTELTEPGKYKVMADGIGESYEFSIGKDIYKDVLKDLMKFFYYQRCGTELTEEYAGTWAHPACHMTEATIYGTDKKIDVSGGWHDAGDYGRYVVATSKAVADLMLAYQYNPDAFGDDTDIPESGNGIPDVLDEVKYQLEWLFKMQDEESGGVYHKVTCANFPGFVMPQEETAELIVCPISTTATGDFGAVMAMASEVYKEMDPELSDKCLKAAKKALDYLKETPASVVGNPEGIVTGAYDDDYDGDERAWLVTQLFKATGDDVYGNEIKNGADELKEQSMPWVGYDWRFVVQYAIDAYLSSDKADQTASDQIKVFAKRYTDKIIMQITNDGYNITSDGTDYIWGSNGYFLNRGLTLDKAYRNDPSLSDYEDYAIEQVNYCFGKNPLSICYVTGYGTNYAQHPHHRLSGAKNATIPGMLVGGADANLEDDVVKEAAVLKSPGECYCDDQGSYSTNEVDIYWNSTLVYALASLGLV